MADSQRPAAEVPWRLMLHVAARSVSACALLLAGAGALFLALGDSGGMGGRSAVGQVLLLCAFALALLAMPAAAGALLSRSMGALARTGAVLLPVAMLGSAFYVTIGALLVEARGDRTLAMMLVSSVTLFLGLWLIATERASWRQYVVLLALALVLARCVPLGGIVVGVAAWVLLPAVVLLLDHRRRRETHP